MKVLVTGAAGFIGSHVTNAMHEAGHDVYPIDNNFVENISYQRLREFLKVKPLLIDLLDYGDLHTLCMEEEFDAVYHFAGLGSVKESEEDPGFCCQSNIEIFANVLQACRHAGIKKVIHASSSSVYGDGMCSEYYENPTPVNVYGAAKKAAEVMAEVFCNEYNINVTSLRFFTVYGPWGRPDMAIWKFTESLVNGETLSLYNEGKYKRDFVYVDDVVSAVMRTADPSFDTSGIINVGSGKSVSLTYVVQKLVEILTHRKVYTQSAIDYLPSTGIDPESTQADLSEMVRLLKCLPHYSIEAGLERFVDWYLKTQKIPSGHRRI